MKQMREHLYRCFEQYFRISPQHCSALKGDGSDRKIFRLTAPDARAIAVYGENRQENEAFVSFTTSFLELNLPVPQLYDYDPHHNIYLIEDLGDVTLNRWVERQTSQHHTESIHSMYQQVLDYLLHFQFKGRDRIDFSKCYQFEIFDRDAMHFDLTYFINYFIKSFIKKEFNYFKLNQNFKNLISRLNSENTNYFLYRDFQSKNIMIYKNKPRFIDYQSGRRGALQYDVASLLFDANVDLSSEDRHELLEYYLEQATMHEKINSSTFKAHFYDFALIRLLQALAAFTFLSMEKGKIEFLNSIPQALDHLKALLEEPGMFRELSELRRIFEEDIFINDSLIENIQSPVNSNTE